MAFKKRSDEDAAEDPTGWLIAGSLAEFLLLHTDQIRYMAMFGYTYLHGVKLFPTLPKDSALSFKFVSMIFQCVGGGILVPLFINSIPVPLSTDAYPIAIFASFLLHQYFPILRDVVLLSPLLKTAFIVLYECQRAAVVTKLTLAAAATIAPSDFSGMAVFGPIFCGAVSGCGGAFLPLNKGLSPIEKTGLAQPMLSALIAATCLHFFIGTGLSDGVVEAKKKAQVVMAIYFIVYNLYSTFAPTYLAATKTQNGESKKSK
ncbi:hypothetical protein FisN_17Hh148 [Fistulifera solaris]|uniref:Uncharacterized protein n=1 Tax=Fistulifera solaris TaxID=1519565 RepID=A0A1Z5JH15_FISSO|nr:hypothetical protein FisN_17Hh148 [Fistulifera solaris]|eukprot:GAX13216.1 hypothetical protein FisN_17Hh148 [Fistulifera solaris]